MVGKLVTLVTLFTLVLAAAAVASPADQSDMASETESAVGETDLEARVGEHDQDEEEFELYLGPQDETIAGREDRRVD